MSDPILRVEELQKVFAVGGDDTLEAVCQISFEVERGEIFAFLGPNGAGKTTTIGMMTTQMRPTGGRVLLDDESIWASLPRTRRKISVVAQHNNIDRGLTARENLLFHARYFGIPGQQARQRAEGLLDTMGILGRADDPVGNLSGGMVQRVKIARALMHDPEVLFLDEPTAGLDPQARTQLWARLKELHQEGMTIFLSSHYMEEPERLADRVAILHKGELQAVDIPDRLKELVPGKNVIRVHVDQPVDQWVEEARELPDVEDVSVQMQSLHLYMSTSTPDLAEVVEWCKERDMSILDLELRLSTLDDVFVHLTGRGLEQ